MLPDRVSNPGPLTYESGALPIALRGPAHLLDNHVVISEHRKSCYWKTSAQSSQKMGFGKITPQSRVGRNTF